MAKPYSDDLRERVVAAIESGHTREEVAELYNFPSNLHGDSPASRSLSGGPLGLRK